MENKNRYPALIKKRDLIILGIVIIVLTVWMIWSYLLKPKYQSAEETYAWIYQDNDLLKKIHLDGNAIKFDIEVIVAGDTHILKIETYEDKSIAVIESDCPDQICVRTGKVSIMGQSIACLPNHVIIKIGSETNPIGEGGIDG